jgi:hypothetical protein
LSGGGPLPGVAAACGNVVLLDPTLMSIEGVIGQSDQRRRLNADKLLTTSRKPRFCEGSNARYRAHLTRTSNAVG